MTVIKTKMTKIIRQLEFSETSTLINYMVNKLRKSCDSASIDSNEDLIPTLNIDEAIASIKKAENFEEILRNGFLLHDEIRTQTLRLTLTPRLLR
ncbi:hypothetical protein K7432_016731 [Basidiobolus ranarum]|uniref:Uncharacterized protein n=1 Tax=Basidiobolus ranarum TaxID=34480 RepID=A0ABR2WEA6_9FUNG